MVVAMRKPNLNVGKGCPGTASALAKPRICVPPNQLRRRVSLRLEDSHPRHRSSLFLRINEIDYLLV